MWARVVELMLGLWLVVSPFVFRHPPGEVAYWINDLGGGAAVVAFSLLSFAPGFRYAHLLTAAVALWLVGFGYFGGGAGPPPALQNDLLVGLTLLMLAILPSEAHLPPPAWRDLARADSDGAGRFYKGAL